MLSLTRKIAFSERMSIVAINICEDSDNNDLLEENKDTTEKRSDKSLLIDRRSEIRN